ncbi:14175_t:CDS:2 [Racocetra fulgida]|uniref:14175_t:CDS:1 n=1 Tax=Racocetra fulgida TaxID=60492 RepID=A0A9N9CWG8_9GLOM|nr:14175_t:CDS:2 [Racocetra fulgida]
MGNEVNQSQAAATARELMKQKDAIENKIKEFEQVLIDSSGFPRADIDLMTVRTARSRIIALQNDHKDIMSRIESALHEIHAENKANRRLEETICWVFDPSPY